MDYINELRENILEAYTGIFQALSGPKGQRTRTMKLALHFYSVLGTGPNLGLSPHVEIPLSFLLYSRPRRLYRRHSGGAGIYFPNRCRPYPCRWVHPPLCGHCWVGVAEASRRPQFDTHSMLRRAFSHPGGHFPLAGAQYSDMCRAFGKVLEPFLTPQFVNKLEQLGEWVMRRQIYSCPSSPRTRAAKPRYSFLYPSGQASGSRQTNIMSQWMAKQIRTALYA